MHSRNTPRSTRHATSFDQVVEHLGLSPRQYAASTELNEWARQHKDEKYVPPRLLDLWGFDVKVEIAGLLKKPPNRAA